MPGLLSEHRLAGVLLVFSLLSFAVGASLPTVGPRGNINIFTLPVREYLLAVADNAAAWRWANVFMGAASLLLVAGLTMLTVSLEGAGEHVLSRLGLAGIPLATISWLVFS